MKAERFDSLERKLLSKTILWKIPFETAVKELGIDLEEAEEIYSRGMKKNLRNLRTYASIATYDVYLGSSFRTDEQFERIYKVEKMLKSKYKVFSPANLVLPQPQKNLFDEEMIRRCRAFFGLYFSETPGFLMEARAFLDEGKSVVFWGSEEYSYFKEIHPIGTGYHFNTDLKKALKCLELSLEKRLKIRERIEDGILVERCEICGSRLRIKSEIEDILKIWENKFL